MNSPHRSTKPLHDVTCIRPHEMQTEDALISIPQTDGLETHTREWNEKKSRYSDHRSLSRACASDRHFRVVVYLLFVCLFIRFVWGFLGEWGYCVISNRPTRLYVISSSAPSHPVPHPIQYPTHPVPTPPSTPPYPSPYRQWPIW